MFSKSRLGLLVSAVALVMMLTACSLFDVLWQNPSSVRVPATPRPAVPIPKHILGEAGAPITVEEYVDFQCPVCGAFARGTLQEIKEKYVKTGKIKWTIHHFAFIGDESTRAAEASECAADQGKFWEFADVLFQNQSGENQGAFAEAKLQHFAQLIHLNVEQFKTCLADQRHLAEVQASTEEGMVRGVGSVPTLFINGQMVIGTMSLAEFETHLPSTSK